MHNFTIFLENKIFIPTLSICHIDTSKRKIVMNVYMISSMADKHTDECVHDIKYG